MEELQVPNLEQKICNCLLIEGAYAEGGGYIDVDREGIDVMVQNLVTLFQKYLRDLVESQN